MADKFLYSDTLDDIERVECQIAEGRLRLDALVRRRLALKGLPFKVGARICAIRSRLDKLNAALLELHDDSI